MKKLIVTLLSSAALRTQPTMLKKSERPLTAILANKGRQCGWRPCSER
ncbi:hypothetical protein V8069_004317 [Vibrio parahaemolyticus]|nr:hypothetical protein [Vibrio parahaemolyticus]EJG0898656.1 hypothetical protein [Vibrio parahaemolyticus]EJG1284860.1 hypothetical protein [Vibrio parahaemolyticus]EJI6220656.1 hypothetical protein [Vibrio parahaemolyticus]ELA7220685.1 hypothetical protein [Vibrio parahaemolyticus]